MKGAQNPWIFILSQIGVAHQANYTCKLPLRGCTLRLQRIQGEQAQLLVCRYLCVSENTKFIAAFTNKNTISKNRRGCTIRRGDKSRELEQIKELVRFFLVVWLIRVEFVRMQESHRKGWLVWLVWPRTPKKGRKSIPQKMKNVEVGK